MVATGVRKLESTSRKTRSAFEVIGKTKKESLRFTTDHIQEVYEEAKQEAKECGKSAEEASPFDCTFVSKAKQKKKRCAIQLSAGRIRKFGTLSKKKTSLCAVFTKMGITALGA